MHRRTRALVELTSWFTQHLWEFFAHVPAADEFEDRLVELNARELDPSFEWADAYQLRLFPDVLTSEPRILPPGYKPTGSKEPVVEYTFAMWSPRQPLTAAGDELQLMRRRVIPDLFGYAKSDGIARRRLARLAEILEQRIPGHQFQHFATVPSGPYLVSAFVDLKSLEHVADLIE